MLIEIYLLLQVVVIGLFLISFFTKQEVLWIVTVVMAALMMFSSYNVEYSAYKYNVSTSAYEPTVIEYNYLYMLGMNSLFFGLALIFGFFDLFDKYRPGKREEEG
jgi:hypothetical protein